MIRTFEGNLNSYLSPAEKHDTAHRVEPVAELLTFTDKEQNRLASPARRASLTWPSPAFLARSLSFLGGLVEREKERDRTPPPRGRLQ
jgi:hypothetical protein